MHPPGQGQRLVIATPLGARAQRWQKATRPWEKDMIIQQEAVYAAAVVIFHLAAAVRVPCTHLRLVWLDRSHREARNSGSRGLLCPPVCRIASCMPPLGSAIIS